MPSVGLPELIVIMLILALVFGGSRLPKIGENLGRSFGKFKRGVTPKDDGGTSDDEAAEDAEIVD